METASSDCTVVLSSPDSIARDPDAANVARATRQMLVIDRATLDAVVAHLRASLPEEGCGLLATVAEPEGGRRVARFYPGTNVDHSPTRYTMDPREVFAAIEDMEANGFAFGAIAHSHPRTPAVPSPTDLREAYYAETWLVIVSFAGAEAETRAWDVGSRPPIEVELVVRQD